jgi:hypothetical protein
LSVLVYWIQLVQPIEMQFSLTSIASQSAAQVESSKPAQTMDFYSEEVNTLNVLSIFETILHYFNISAKFNNDQCLAKTFP